MLKKLRWRFIMIATTATFIVLSVLVAAINLINYKQVTGQLDRTLDAISAFHDEVPGPFDVDEFARSDAFGGSPAQAQSAAIFFSVTYGAAGETPTVKNNFISSLTYDDAIDSANTVREEGIQYGYYGEYRYQIVEQDGEITVFFLNAVPYVRQLKSLTSISCIVALVSLLAIFALTGWMSKRAIVPFIKNMETQKQFITNASHEIKTPVAAIATSADVLALEQSGNKWVENIQQQTIRLSKLVGDLITLSRLNEDLPFPDKKTFSLSDTLNEAAAQYAILAAAKGKVFTQSIEANLAMVGDRSSVEQLITILLENAVKYSTEDGCIRLSAAKKGRKILIEVSNTCDCVDINDMDRLFDRFYRPDKSRAANTGGSGIGLAIAKAIAEAHGGTIIAHCTDGKQISFCVTL